VCTKKKKPGESCIVASLQPPSFYFSSLFSSVALFIFSLSLIGFFVMCPIFFLSNLFNRNWFRWNQLTMVVCAE
jgi:hypothetical protein